MTDENDSLYEVFAIQLWRRLAPGARGPQLTLAEAAATLGVSADTIRRRIRRGEVMAWRDEAGRYWVVPEVGSAEPVIAAEPVVPAPATEDLALLTTELEETRRLVLEARRQRDVLRPELEATRQALAEAQAELAELWRQLNAFQRKGLQTPPLTAVDLADRQGADRVRAVIYDARELFRRRQHRWPLAG